MDENTSWFQRLLKLNPSLVIGVASSVFMVLAGLGVTWATDENEATIAGLVAAVFQLLAAFSTRQQVVPEAKVLAYLPDPVDSPTTILPGKATVDPALASDAGAAAVQAA